jgi:plastocyanin
VSNARNIAAAVLAATGVALAIAPAQAGTAKKKRTVSVEVGDYYFSPAKLTIKRNTIVVWKWPAGGGDAHDVVLKKGPRGVKKFASEVFLADEKYRKRLTVPGRYSIICSLHPEDMRQTITVKR